MRPAYIASFENGTLKKASQQAGQMLLSCNICPRNCGIDRTTGKTGFCRTALKAKVYNHMSHHGEEPPVSGTRGSGTIFFSNCNMACVYCQNYDFSQSGQGREVTTEELASFMLELQAAGCHNINLVTPTHVMPQILASLLVAIPQGLDIPLVYNSGGYEKASVVGLLDGIVDIYLADMRYGDNNMAKEYSSAPDYVENNQASLKEMYRQTGLPQFDQEGVITRGLIIRHLVLPNDVSGTGKIMEFISRELSPESYISLMSQYLPYHKAKAFPQIARRLKDKEYLKAQEIMDSFGLHNGWIQESYGEERFAGVNIKPSLLKDDQ